MSEIKLYFVNILLTSQKTNLPIPMVVTQTQPKNAELMVKWQCHAPDNPAFTLHHFMVNVEGTQFDKHIDSHFR